MKKNLDPLAKAKLIYSGELIIIAVAVIVVALLKIFGIIPTNENVHYVFNWITIFGGSWAIIDFFWAVFSKKRRPKISLIDKILHFPAGVYFVSYDLYCIITKTKDPNILRYGFPIVILYLCACYIFEGIYHFYYPTPALLATIAEEEVKEEAANEEAKEEKKDEQ